MKSKNSKGNKMKGKSSKKKSKTDSWGENKFIINNNKKYKNNNIITNDNKTGYKIIEYNIIIISKII